MRMAEGFPDGRSGTCSTCNVLNSFISNSEPLACMKRSGPTPSHPEPGRETLQRGRYCKVALWETRSVRHPLNHPLIRMNQGVICCVRWGVEPTGEVYLALVRCYMTAAA